ncbi:MULTISPECIES: HD domain-containing protein [Vibrio]|jgi:putative hydrolase of HD superfamily|uniref:HD domain-containing protein n=6 Tax=Vibrio TaxID=662 RepID=A0A0H0Y7W2_VIBAL|nr:MULTISPECIES: HD domain-containing protein [Vibrio]EEZ81784.1 Predicted hydrolase [Vibrio alginolyticus 40B]MDW1969272.1 HD domain-containing protein [Vibrio sp. 945]MDW2294694.1 HD domain-containing protein [Vibrio sp. 1404]NAW53719.1 HD domain-containing protein [Vibrio sp. V41_P2S12T139]NAW95515.1 HD domain-containing protein [Vibrio sp. V42_P2S4T144]QCO86445.1 HD domain-containing protein [Vibrio neocaledonicus]GAJ72468.1 predicted hydrolase [Vibrio sp. JCM 18904]|eukprot:NODE_3313_length_1243_cov_2.250000_g3146_i0.p1 GENE.NODE_3313_length_1243_cov_2.250000_g3146_i0~~NODE_3313_length_1243_cov_2.250000_g3146_i0.p1  ORF type:complete len:196 (-),score=4.00 NODE_3313_length_1243_cov_2.250000_g3146_i0:239-826(-)
MERLEKQLALVIELDKLKSILRRTRVKSAEGRLENSGEHSWHVALMAILMEEHANAPVDICRVMKMLLIHDVVEIDAGDTFVYDTAASQEQAEKEIRAAERLFGMLPSDQEQELLALWHEFEAAQTDDAKYAKALDRLIPMLLNYHNNGQSWKEHGVSREQALTINKRIEFGSVTLWDKAKELIEEATEKGWLKS